MTKAGGSMKTTGVETSSQGLQAQILIRKDQDSKGQDSKAIDLAIKRAIKCLEDLYLNKKLQTQSIFWDMINKIIRELESYRKLIIKGEITPNYIADLKLIINLVNDPNEDLTSIKDHVNRLLFIQPSSPLKPLALVVSALCTYETETVKKTLKPDTSLGIAKALKSFSIQKANESLEALLNNHYNPTNPVSQVKSPDDKNPLINSKISVSPPPTPSPSLPVTMSDQYDRVVNMLLEDKADLVKVNDAVREFMGRHGAALEKCPEQKEHLNDLIDKKLPSTEFLKEFTILNKNILGENVNPINIYHFMITTKKDAFLDGYVSRMGKKFGNNYGKMYNFYKALLTQKYLSTLGNRGDLNETAKTILFEEAKLENKTKLGSIKSKISIANSDETVLAITMILYYGTCENQSWYSRSSSFNFSDRTALAKAIFGQNYGNLANDIKDQCFIGFYHKVLKAIEFRNTLTSAVKNPIVDKNKCQQLAQEAVQRREDFLSKSAPHPDAFKRALLEEIIREIYYNDDNLRKLDISKSTIKYYQQILDSILNEPDDSRAIYGMLDFAKRVFNNPYQAPSCKQHNRFFNKNTNAEEYRLKRDLEIRLAQVFGEVHHSSNTGTKFRNNFDALHKVFQSDDDVVFNFANS